MLRKALLALIALVMAVVMALTWGSIGSAILGYCLVMMAAAVVYQRFLTNREESDFDMEV